MKAETTSTEGIEAREMNIRDLLTHTSGLPGNGQDPRHFDMVVVKSPHCEPHMFADWCAKLINVDAPGSTSANLPRLGHTICARPSIPLDEGVKFDPVADVFRRW